MYYAPYLTDLCDARHCPGHQLATRAVRARREGSPVRSRVRTTGGALIALTGLLALSACSSSSDNKGSSSSSTKSSGKAQVGVILPDTTSSARYTQYDAPLLKKAFDAAGVKADIQNAQGDNAKFV